MEVYQGKSVFGGIAIGRISVHKKDEQQVKRVRIEDPEQEILRYRQAKQTAMEQLQGLYQKALKEVGEANAAIFEIHQMMLEDDDYNESVENIIRMQQVNAEYAVASTGDNFAQMFSAMDDDYMRARSGCQGYFRARVKRARRPGHRDCRIRGTGDHRCRRPGSF